MTNRAEIYMGKLRLSNFMDLFYMFLQGGTFGILRVAGTKDRTGVITVDQSIGRVHTVRTVYWYLSTFYISTDP